MPYKDPIKGAHERYMRNQEDILAERRARFKNDKQYRERVLQYGRNYYWKMKLKALQKISGLKIPKCVYCGCSDLRILEMNHKNLDGFKDYRVDKDGERYKKGSSRRSLYHRVNNGERELNDLEVACRVCNTKHYVEKKFGLYFEVIFRGEQNEKEN